MLENERYNELIDNAWKEFNKENYEECESICKTLITELPDSEGGYYLLGHINWKTKDYKQALKFFSTALNKAAENRQKAFIIGLPNYMQIMHLDMMQRIQFMIAKKQPFIIKKQENVNIIPKT
jgi:tetratricopeptide (TPR) repeat protein